ncbi:MAG TPA: succinate dehydrogenase cytochrome b subunit [Salinivirgaceae bacterium]|nr:succinate dehydrogenase cytochrome b subunit [Salinivirgaceae bacterium]
MKNFLLTSSIGKKFVVSLSGLFLMAFITVHLTVNLMLVIDDSGNMYNIAANFMGTNPIIKVVEPVLAIGFLIHIAYTITLTIQNLLARPKGYAKSRTAAGVSWASRNMFILGGLIAVFLALHLMNFFIKMKFTGDPLYRDIVVNGETMKNSYLLVSSLFRGSLAYSLLYIAGAILLGLHLTHGFWSAFQSIGFNNDIWLPRLKTIALIFAVVVATGFAIIPIYFRLF